MNCSGLREGFSASRAHLSRAMDQPGDSPTGLATPPIAVWG